MGMLEHAAGFHHEGDVHQRRDIGQGIAVDGDDVGELARLGQQGSGQHIDRHRAHSRFLPPKPRASRAGEQWQSHRLGGTRVQAAGPKAPAQAPRHAGGADRVGKWREEKRPGGAERDRTADLVNAIHALSQLSYSPVPDRPALGRRTRTLSKSAGLTARPFRCLRQLCR